MMSKLPHDEQERQRDRHRTAEEHIAKVEDRAKNDPSASSPKTPPKKKQGMTASQVQRRQACRISKISFSRAAGRAAGEGSPLLHS